MASPGRIRAALSLASLGTLVLTTAACSKKAASASHAADIFTQDQGDPNTGNALRHPASSDDLLWTISMGGCTGHLIAPEYMMTAGHCEPQAGAQYTSGAALAQGNQSPDITVTEVTELSPPETLDYAILHIQWANGLPKTQRFPPTVATRASDVTVSPTDGQGDGLFTVGFPQDKDGTWGPTYSEGNAKAQQDPELYYNIGIINGNSGGGVWRKSDHMLVSLTNNGPHSFDQEGWDTASSSDESSWNFGPAMWDIYAASAQLRDIFPGGKNRFAQGVGAGGATTTPPPAGTTPPTGTTPPATGGATGAAGLFLAIGEADPTTTDAFTLYVSVPANAAQVVFCPADSVDQCTPDAVGFTTTAFVRNIGGQGAYRALSTTQLADGLALALIATDASGNTVAQQVVQLQQQ